MADMSVTPARGGRSKATPHIDLTPMVDLGFLLITFFMMTTTMAGSKIMDIQMPYVPAPLEGTTYYETSAITLLPAKDHKIFYYEGMFKPGIDLKVAGNDQELRTILAAKQRVLMQRKKPDEHQLQVLIKSHPAATVNDIVGLFDEMNILQVKHYALVDIDSREQDMIDKKTGL